MSLMSSVVVREVETNWVRIYMAGQYDAAVSACNEYCFASGLCVTVTATKYVYTGGVEDGVMVELINYPRFPTSPDDLLRTANRLAEILRRKLCQGSYTVMSPSTAVWYSYRSQDKE